MKNEKELTKEINQLIKILPLPIQKKIKKLNEDELIEVIVDLGRPIIARLKDEEVILTDKPATARNILQITKNLSPFGDDNRAGIEKTLHRISVIRNRKQKIIGITARIGRSVEGSAEFIQDYVKKGQSILLLGKPGIGKTTMLRELARISADDLRKRVIIVDTSNEIAGDGDIPHYGIGNARRMQVEKTNMQHKVMIEAVENHNPEVIVIDEISTKEEAEAARTIAERGVQLIATAHGNKLTNLMQNPTLCDLIGGIEPVTLGDEEAKRRGTQKIVLERRSPPTFNTLVEIQSFTSVAVYKDIGTTIDKILRGVEIEPEHRGVSTIIKKSKSINRTEPLIDYPDKIENLKKIHPYAIDKNRIEEVISTAMLPYTITDKIKNADLVLTLRPYYRRKKGPLKEAEESNIPIHVLRNNTKNQILQVLSKLTIENKEKQKKSRELNLNKKSEEQTLQQKLEQQYG